MKMSIRDITAIIKGQLILGDPKTEIAKASCDSRLVQDGDLFFALKGERVDGHDYVNMACREGASGVVVSQLNWMKKDRNLRSAVIRVTKTEDALRSLARHLRKKFKGPVVGVTGSNGKTTTKQMIKKILETKSLGLATRGNFNSQVGLPLVLSELRPEHKWMALEMGASEPGNIMALANLAHPTVGVITSIGPAHLATFGSIEKIAESKWELMDSLPPKGVAVLPWGVTPLEPHIRSFKKKIVFFGDDPACAVRATSIQTGEKIQFRLHVASQSANVTLPVSGRMNVHNALAAAAVGWTLGYEIDKIVKGLETFEPPQMRMEVVNHASGAIFVNDAYNANPASMLESVRSLVETYPNKKRVLILGTMLELGEDSDRWHFHLGTELARFDLNRVFLYGKEMEQVQNGAVSAGKKKEDFPLVVNQENLADELETYLKPETVILFKGSRGMQLEKTTHALLAR